MTSCAICSCGKEKSASSENIVSLDVLEPHIQKLLHDAVDARLKAYCPYSKFKVGAAVLCNDGKIYKGCNIENGSYTVGLCAERTAYAKAISDGHKQFKAVAVIARQEKSFTTPCGACRQFLREFGAVDIYCAKPNLDEVLVTTLDELLPMAFVSV